MKIAPEHSSYDVIGIGVLVLTIELGFAGIGVAFWFVPSPLNYFMAAIMFCAGLYILITFLAWLKGDLP